MKDEFITQHVGIFMRNMVEKNGLDSITIITSRGDRVGLHSSVKDEDVIFKILEKVMKHRKTFKDVKPKDEKQ